MSSSFRRPSKPQHETTSSEEGGNTGSSRKATARLRGTKPWTNGITLTSMGVRDVDAIFGGGQPLGTCVLLEEDRWTLDFGWSLVRYWCAEAISQKQFLWIPILHHATDGNHHTEQSLSDDYNEEYVPRACASSSRTFLQRQKQVDELLRRLPRNLHWDKQQDKQVEQQPHSSGKLEPLMEGNDDDDSEGGQDQVDDAVDDDDVDEDNDAEGLQIAWQYRKSIQQQRLGHTTDASPSALIRSTKSSSSNYHNIFCHSYDLSGCMVDQKPWSDLLQYHCTEPVEFCTSNTSALNTTCSNHQTTCGYRLFQRLSRRLQELLQQHPNQVLRLLLYRIDEDCDMMSVALPLLLCTIRQHEWPVVILITVQSWKITTTNGNSSLLTLRRTADVALQLEAFAARRDYPPPPEFRQFQGVMVVLKLAPASVVSGHFVQTMLQPPAMVYGMKRDRRKLHISLLHIPPEDYAHGGGSVGTSAVRSGAGRSATAASSSATSSTGCGSGSGGKSSSIDF